MVPGFLDRKRWRDYFSNPFIVSGLILGFIGIALFSYMAPDTKHSDNNNNLLGTMLTLVASIMWVVGTLYNDRHPEVKKHPHVLITGIQLAGAGVVSAVIALLFGEWNTFTIRSISLQAWGGLIYLIFMGSIVAYAAFMWLIKVQPPALVSTHTYVNPIVAVFAGWLLANEHITAIQAITLVVVFAGLILTRIKTRDKL